jgi:hypothetical protein
MWGILPINPTNNCQMTKFAVDPRGREIPEINVLDE